MVSITSADARKSWSSILKLAQTDPVTITSHSVPAAILIAPELYQRAIQALEDAEDLRDALSAQTDGEIPIGWEQVQKDLGLI